MNGYVSQEYVERLRNMGASDYAVEFAQRRVARFSQEDIDREAKRTLAIGFLWGIAIAMLIVAALALLPAPVIAEEPLQSVIGAPPKADQAADLASARDPLDGRESPRQRPAQIDPAAFGLTGEGAETAGGAPTPTGEISTALLGGFATWYETPGYVAAAGPALRAALGPDWRGTLIEVSGPGRFSVVVSLDDWCACGSRGGLPTLLDLSRTAFAELADPSVGVVAVSVEIAHPLPRTDTDVRMMLEVRDDNAYR